MLSSAKRRAQPGLTPAALHAHAVGKGRFLLLLSLSFAIGFTLVGRFIVDRFIVDRVIAGRSIIDRVIVG